MIKIRVFAGSVLLGLSAIANVSHAAGDVARGEVVALPCLGCHGIPGYQNAHPAYHVPKIGGQSAAYLVSALKAYKSGERDHKTMQAQAHTLSDQDMEDVAAYLAAKTK